MWAHAGMILDVNSKRFLAAAAALAGLLGLAACSSDSKSGASTTAGPVAPTTTIEGVQSYDGLTQEHVTGDVDYPQSPPVGGDHDPRWQNCGVYDTPVRNENAVHSLEHGAVWLAYRPDLAADQVEVLRAFARGHTHILVSPYEGLTEAVVTTAWGTQLRLDSVIDPRLALFVATYEEGPQTPELGVTCSGAVGSPIE
jgi:hypothetical protein